jgi:hypothetical protein
MPSVTRRAPRARVPTLVVSALAALTATLALAPAAPAAVRSNVVLNVSGTHNFGALGVYAISGGASITSMQVPGNPIVPPNPIRVLTIATVARATNGPTTCSYTGSTTVTVPATDTTSVDAIVVPSNPITPSDSLCPSLGSFAIRYSLAISADNTITAATAQTDPVT